MVIIEIPPNQNCSTVDLRVFHGVEPPRRVQQLYLERVPGQPGWFEVTGWTTAGTACPAFAQRVDDSGEGLAILVYGGDAGLRFRPAGSARPWQLAAPEQWGEAFLLMGDAHAMKVAAEHEGP